MEAALLELQEELKLSHKSSAFKEVKILKKVVQSLEEELTKERTKHQRAASKRLQESRQLADEVGLPGASPGRAAVPLSRVAAPGVPACRFCHEG